MKFIKIKEDNSNLPPFGEVVLLLQQGEDKNVVATGKLSIINKDGAQWDTQASVPFFGEMFSVGFKPTHYCEIVLPTDTEPKLTDEHLVYLSDEMYTPIHYKGIIVEQPFFEGKGSHSVAQLEEICEQFQNYAHQQAVIKQNCMKHIVELKFGIDLHE